MLDLNGILKIYNDLDWELSQLKDISNLSNWWYFESLLSNIDWHIYFLYRIKDKNYFDYFLLSKEFWEEIKNNNLMKDNISLKNYDYKKWFELFDKLKDDDNFIVFFNKYKAIQIEKITNRQEILSFSQAIKILKKIKEYKPSLKIDFFDLDIDDYENFSKNWFNNEKSIISEYLRKSAIYDFNFEKFYLLKKGELDKKISLAEDSDGNPNELYHDLWILNTYNRFYKLYSNLINLSYLKIVLLKIINFWNIFDENREYLLSLLIFHFSKNKQEAKKINFIFKNHFAEVVILLSVLLILWFWNIFILTMILLFLISLFIIKKLIVYLIDKPNFNNFFKITFSIILLLYAIANVFENSITLSFIKALPQQWVVNIVFQDKKIKRQDIEKNIREKLVELYKQLNNVDLQSNISNWK